MSPYEPDMEATMKRLYESLNEKDRRRYAGVEALKLGPGGRNYIARVLGSSRRTVSKGAREVSGLSRREVEARIRQPGGGRKDYQVQWPDLDTPFLAVLRDHTAGDPMDDTVRWTNLSLEEIATRLWEDHDVQVSKNVVRQRLKKHGFRRRKAQQKRTLKQVAHRNEPFENIHWAVVIPGIGGIAPETVMFMFRPTEMSQFRFTKSVRSFMTCESRFWLTADSTLPAMASMRSPVILRDSLPWTSNARSPSTRSDRPPL